MRTRDGGTSHKIVQSIRAAMQRGIQKRILLKHPQHLPFSASQIETGTQTELSWDHLAWVWDSVTDSILYCFCFCLFVYHVRTYLTRPTNADTQQKYFSFRKVVRENRFERHTQRDLSILYSRLVIVVYIIFAFVMSIICREIVNTFWAWLDPHHSWGS